jgi:hypothetical protein
LTRETIVRLPHCFVAYRPPEETAEVSHPPCLKNGYITFGYSGRTERLNHRTFRVWGEILKQNPAARLILDYRTFADPPTQAHYRQFMARHGMDIGRVIMRRSDNIFAGLNDIDILLDCFPHSGGTMLFDALWIGVPILTLSSRPPVGRIGTSLMINLGLLEWVAESEEEYIAKACAFAQNTQALAQLRAGMRERMQNSPIMDGAGFARGVEEAYRGMFEKWVHHQHHGLRGEAMDVQPMPLEERKSKKLYPKSETKEHTKTARPDKLTRKATIYGSVEPSADDVNALVVLFNQKHYVEMEAAAQRLLVHYPKCGIGWKALGTALSQQGRTAEALEPMRTTIWAMCCGNKARCPRPKQIIGWRSKSGLIMPKRTAILVSSPKSRGVLSRPKLTIGKHSRSGLIMLKHTTTWALPSRGKAASPKPRQVI